WPVWNRDTLARSDRKPTPQDGRSRVGVRKSSQKKVQGWLAARDLKDLFEVDLTEVHGLPVLSYRFREEAWQQLQATRLGKTILFTDRTDWTDAVVVRGSRNQHHVESAFRDLKHVKHLSLRPQRHWTDQKIQ